MAVSRGADEMAALIPVSFPTLPAMVANSGGRAGVRFLEFFTAQIRNPHTRRAYARAAAEFLACAKAGASLPSLRCSRCTWPHGSSSRANRPRT